MNRQHRHTRIAERAATRLKLKQIRLLAAIADHDSILHAARTLNISQPVATKLVKDLETDFGIKLFDRTNRGVVPTVFGEALIRHSKLILAQISHAAQELDDLSEGAGGRVVVGTLLAASAALLPAAIRSLQEQRPNVAVTIREGTNDILMPALRSGEVDMVVGRLPEYRHRRELVQEKLLEESIRVVARAAHELAAGKDVSFEELGAYQWILPPTDTTLRRQIDKEFLDRGLPAPTASLESVSFLTNRAVLESTDMIGVFPAMVVDGEIHAGRLAGIDCSLRIPSGPVGVSYRRDARLSPAANLFLEILRQCAQASGTT